MQELLDLRRSLEEGRYADAIFIIDEMDEMAKDDKINKIGSYMVILLIHIIKHHAEKRMTRSWRNSILNALDQIHQSNKRRSAGGMYMNAEELRAVLEENFKPSLRRASEEVFEGQFDTKELARMIDAEAIKAEALEYILNGYPESEE